MRCVEDNKESYRWKKSLSNFTEQVQEANIQRSLVKVKTLLLVRNYKLYNEMY